MQASACLQGLQSWKGCFWSCLVVWGMICLTQFSISVVKDVRASARSREYFVGFFLLRALTSGTMIWTHSK